MKNFEIIHATHLHPPYGLWIVRHRGVVIGKQISQPNQEQCEHMLTLHREAKARTGLASAGTPKPVSYHLGPHGAEQTRKSQRRGGFNKSRRTA